MTKNFFRTHFALTYLLLLLIAGSAFAQKVLPVADAITVKVAVVIQDPRIPAMGNKRMHEIFKTPGYTFQWHDGTN